MAPSDVIGCGVPGDPVADDDDALDAAVVVDLDPRRRDERDAAQVERDVDVAEQPRGARHSTIAAEPEPLERRPLTGRRRRQPVAAVEHGDRIGAAHAHPAARLDVEIDALGRLEQCRARRHDDAQPAGRELHLRPIGATLAGDA